MRESLIAGQYLLIEQVGRGGFAVVWRARDQWLQRDVAVKQLFLAPHFTEEQRREHRERTFREARSAARLSHPGVVTVHDVVEHDGFPWIVMEYVRGRTLGQTVRADGPLPPRRAAEIGLTLLDALRSAHEAGVLHRDVKPSNVIVGERRVVLGDFGIARVSGEDEDDLTQSGVVMGAPSYTAPERARGEPAVAASDLWSLGATLYYAVEGRRAFSGPNPNATFHAILTRETPPAFRAGPLTPVIEGLLRKDAAERMGAEEAAALLTEAAGALPHDDRRRQETRVLPEAARHASRRRSRGREAVRDRRTVRPPLAEAHGSRKTRTDGRRRAPDRRREQTRPISDLARRASGRRGAVGERRTVRPLVALTSVAALSLLLVGNALPVDEPRGRPAASYRRPSPRPRLAATLPTGRSEIISVSFSPDGRTLATGGQDHAVRLWNVAGHRAIGTLSGQRRPVSTTTFSPDGRTLASGAYDGRVILWSGPAHHRTATLDTGGHAIGALAFGPDGRTLAAAGDTLRRWNLTGPPTIHPVPAAGEGVLTAGLGAARLWDPKGRTAPASGGGMALSPDGRTLATGGDHGVRLWDVTGHRLTGTVPGLTGHVTAVAFGPGGHLLACAGDEVVLLWNLRTRALTARLDPRTGTVEALAFSPDGHTLATAGDDGTVRLWTLG